MPWASLSLRNGFRGGVEGAECPRYFLSASPEQFPFAAQAPRCSASPSARSSHSSRAGRKGRSRRSRRASPARGRACPATITQTVPRRLHSMQTLCAAIAGLRPARNAEITSDELRLVDGAAAQLEIDRDMGRDRRRGRERLDIVRPGIDGGDEIVHVREIAQRLDAASGRASADGDQRTSIACAPPECAPHRAGW